MMTMMNIGRKITVSRHLTQDEVNELVNYIQGTVMSLDNATEQLFGVSEMDLDIESLSMIDDYVFECSNCGWWCEISEQNEIYGDSVCDGCLDEEEYEYEDCEDCED
jgi:formylmethanofuran dehydrogenase subunit E